MLDQVKPFNKLLEVYLFRVATNVIDLLDTESQTELINLIIRIDTSSPDVVGEKPCSTPTQQG